MATIRKNSSFKATKFCFRNTDLTSAAMEELLRLNDSEIDYLELWYDNHDGRRASTRKRCNIKLLTAYSLGNLLENKLPNLQMLIIKDLPLSVHQSQIHSLIAKMSLHA